MHARCHRNTLKRPPITLAIPKSVMTSVKMTKPALITPYLAPGSVTVKKTRVFDAPSTSAASYSRPSAIDSAATRIINAWGKQ